MVVAIAVVGIVVVVCYLLFVICCLLFVIRYIVVCCWLLAVCCFVSFVMLFLSKNITFSRCQLEVHVAVVVKHHPQREITAVAIQTIDPTIRGTTILWVIREYDAADVECNCKHARICGSAPMHMARLAEEVGHCSL